MMRVSSWSKRYLKLVLNFGMELIRLTLFLVLCVSVFLFKNLLNCNIIGMEFRNLDMNVLH